MHAESVLHPDPAAPASGRPDAAPGRECHSHACACSGHRPSEADAHAGTAVLSDATAPSPHATATRAVYRIPNMDCPMEEALIRRKLAGVPGVTGLGFNLMRRILTVDHDLPSTDAIEAALRAIDMAPEPLDAPAGARAPADAGGVSGAAQRTPRTPGPALPPAPVIPWLRLGVATALAFLAELAELAHEWGWGAQTALAGGDWPRVAAVALSFAAIALSGLGTFRKGWLAIVNRTLNINALMAVAVTGACCLGQFAEAAMVMALFNLSEAIEARALDRARGAVRDLLALAPPTAEMRQADGTWREVPAAQVAVGAEVRVRPGGRVALDGVVLEGRSAVNQAPITGESMPVEKEAGDSVYAGSINETGSFVFTVTASARDTTLARIIHAVEEAQATRAPMQRLVDSFARWYTPAVFALALAVALLPPLAWGADWRASVSMGLVLLVIGCPCALVISTPVSVVSGMAAAARQGILIKGGAFLEEGRRLNCLALDKTGTLTRGEPTQTDFVLTGAVPAMTEQEAQRVAASLAARSDHPVSRAIAAAASEQGIQPAPVADFEALPGEGVAGTLAGVRWYLGNSRLAQRLAASATDGRTPAQTPAQTPGLAQARALEAQGRTVALLVREAGPALVVAIIAVADALRETSVEAVAALRALGVRTILLTGDNKATARAIAGAAGVDAYHAGLLPQDKLAIVERLEREGWRVGMVGDGINDAPALAKADIGFAMGGAGTDTAIETADVALMDDDLRKIPRFIRLSRATSVILTENIVVALGIKAVFFALTFAGLATMWMAVFADVGAALIVVANGLRALRA